MENTALLLIDFQNDYFASGRWPLDNCEAAANNGAKLLAVFRDKNLPVVHVRHEFPTNEAPFFLPGSEGAQIHPLVAALDDETVVLKHQVNSFKDTELKQILDTLAVNNLIVAGAMSHMCIDAAVRAAADFGYEVTVAQDACATRAQEFEGITVEADKVHASYMAALAFAYAQVSHTDAIIEEIG